jgi:carbon-monoxide dehydrogenase medium subunit
MPQHYLQPHTLPEALALLQTHAGQARIVAGGTDLLVERSRGIRPMSVLIDITKLAELRFIRLDGGVVRIGALATHNDVIASTVCVGHGLPLSQASLELGAPQIRARATVAGNLVTASPANDTITALMALDAEVVLTHATGERVVALRDFYTGPRRTVLRADELLTEVHFAALRTDQRGLFLKLGLRRAQAISVVCVALVVTLAGGVVTEARVALGSLAPTVVRATEAEVLLAGKTLDTATCAEAGRLARMAARPIDDVRGSAGYRLATTERLVADGLARLAAGGEREGWPVRPVLLETPTLAPERLPFDGTIHTTINGVARELAGAQGLSLLDALRDCAHLTGAKEGCGEGECGSCTVWLNGQAVMACLTPAPQAHGGTVTTIEGLALHHEAQRACHEQSEGTKNQSGSEAPSAFDADAGLHPLQVAFIRHGAVQCGFCIPGMLMAGAKLLDEVPDPTIGEVQTALSGNLCRCTGYRKILDAVRDASARIEVSTDE